jgi:hypothetical protein
MTRGFQRRNSANHLADSSLKCNSVLKKGRRQAQSQYYSDGETTMKEFNPVTHGARIAGA